MRKLLLLGLLLASASVQAQTTVTKSSTPDTRTATITFTNGHVSQVTYDKFEQRVTTTYMTTVTSDSSGITANTDTSTAIGSMPSTPVFENMKLIRLGQTKADVQGFVGQPVRITRTINADGITDVWLYGDQS